MIISTSIHPHSVLYDEDDDEEDKKGYDHHISVRGVKCDDEDEDEERQQQ